jgi:hypothetical protein
MSDFRAEGFVARVKAIVGAFDDGEITAGKLEELIDELVRTERPIVTPGRGHQPEIQS